MNCANVKIVRDQLTNFLTHHNYNSSLLPHTRSAGRHHAQNSGVLALLTLLGVAGRTRCLLASWVVCVQQRHLRALDLAFFDADCACSAGTRFFPPDEELVGTCWTSADFVYLCCLYRVVRQQAQVP